MHLNKFFTFLKCFKCGQPNIKRFKSHISESTDSLAKYLNISLETSTKIFKKHKLEKTRYEDLEKTLAELKLLGYTKEEIKDFPNVLKRSPKLIRNQYLVLKEAGFSNLSLLTLSNFKKMVTKKVTTLKLMNFIPQQVNVIDSLIMHLHPKPVDFCIDDLSEEDIFGQIHAAILKQYLQWRLEATDGEIETLFRIYSRFLKYRSFQWLSENIDIALDLGFTPRKLLGFGYLLSNDPSYPKTVLLKMPNFAGADMRLMMRRFPKLITVPPKHFTDIYKILKDEAIPDSTIQKQMNIFTLLPDTIKSRFDDLKDVPEMNVLRQSPRILRLILHYNRAKSRLSFLHQLQLKCATMCLLEHDNEKHFNDYVRNTRDINVLNDILTLLKHLLNSNAPEIEFNLKKHPYHLHVPLVNIEKTCKHIQKSFSNSAIIKVAPIVLYPSEKIEKALKEIVSMTDLPQKHLTEAKKLNLTLYLIEKDHHFTGDGVWEKSSIPIQDE